MTVHKITMILETLSTLVVIKISLILNQINYYCKSLDFLNAFLLNYSLIVLNIFLFD